MEHYTFCSTYVGICLSWTTILCLFSTSHFIVLNYIGLFLLDLVGKYVKFIVIDCFALLVVFAEWNGVTVCYTRPITAHYSLTVTIYYISWGFTGNNWRSESSEITYIHFTSKKIILNYCRIFYLFYLTSKRTGVSDKPSVKGVTWSLLQIYFSEILK